MNLANATSLAVLQTMDTASVLRLQELHRLRKTKLFEALNTISSGNQSLISFKDIHSSPRDFCGDLLAVLHGSPHWLLFRFYLGEEIDKCPQGDTVRGRDFWNWGVFSPIWSLRCHSQCYNPLLDKEKTIAAIIRVIDGLPTTI